MVCIYTKWRTEVKIRALLLGLWSSLALIFSTMKLLLLLVSLFVSDLSPLGDGDFVMDYYSWSLCRKLLHSKQMAPRGLETLLTHMAHYWLCIQSNCDYVAVQYKQWNVLFYQENSVHKDHGHHLSHPALTGIIHSSHFPIMVCLFQSILV